MPKIVSSPGAAALFIGRSTPIVRRLERTSGTVSPKSWPPCHTGPPSPIRIPIPVASLCA